MLTRCRRCSIIYEATGALGSKYCPNCLVIEEEKYMQVRELVKTNPGITIGAVSEATGLSTRKIIAYVKEERLEYSGESHAYVLCEDCGVKIKTGRYCLKCKPKHSEYKPRIIANVNIPGSTESKMFTAGHDD